eukprot:9477861-Heterocapsa_arctica.AAC.1
MPPRSPPTSLKSKGKGKSKATAAFDGLCHRCGRKGHKWADCSARVQVLDDAENDAENIPVPDTGEEEIADDDYEESQ